jgi:arylsulfatase A-like enzyme
MDAHSPYTPPREYAALYGNLPRQHKLNFGTGRVLLPEERQAEIDAYDAAITYLDDELARFIAELDSLGEIDNTILIVTADHGEEFGEHDVFLHGNTLFDRALHVPLLIRIPGSSGGMRRDEWVSLRHLPSTILALAGIDGEPLPGRPLTWAFAPDDSLPPEADTIYAAVSRRPGVLERYPAAKGRMVSVMVDPLKYILGGDGTEQVFNLRIDRDEVRNLIAQVAKSALEMFRARAGAGQAPRS